jgi:signal peptidase I
MYRLFILEKGNIDSRMPIETPDSTKDTVEVVEKPAGPPKTVWREYFESAVVTFIMFLFFITFVGRTVAVPTGSMENTIEVGDHFLINKFVYGFGSHPSFLPQRDVKRGDIVVFKYPGDKYHPGLDESRTPPIVPYETYYIKRVIGMPGDTIEVRGPKVLINGTELPERRIMAETSCEKCPVKPIPGTESGEGRYTVYYRRETLEAGDNFRNSDPEYYKFGVGKPFKIPSTDYFMMGDNRDNSEDSRVWGPLDSSLVVGRGAVVFWSYDEGSPGTFPFSFFSNTRWNRTGTMIK